MFTGNWAILCFFKASEIIGPLSLPCFPAVATGVLALKSEIRSQVQRITFTNLPAKVCKVTEEFLFLLLESCSEKV